MPAFLIPIGVFLASILKPLIARVLTAIGFALTVYVGFDAAFDLVFAYVNDNYSGLPADFLAIANLLGIDAAFSTIISGYSAAFAIRGLCGAVTKVGSKVDTIC